MAKSWKDLSLDEAVARAKTISRQALHIAIKTYRDNGRTDVVEQLLQVRKTLKRDKRIEKVGRETIEQLEAKRAARVARKAEFESSGGCPVPGYSSKWSATPDGRIWSHTHEKWLKPSVAARGRRYMYLNGTNKSAYVHRLIALTFLPNPLNQRNVRHKDGDLANNAVKNLEWFGKPRSTT